MGYCYALLQASAWYQSPPDKRPGAYPEAVKKAAITHAARAAEALGLVVPAERQGSLAAEAAELRERAERCRSLLTPSDEPSLPHALEPDLRTS